eukprot:CAMPEP_0176502382 /NCGR_PEP_ID=MMETSP0200_2-20121128/14719_1 /TAXON_ID=947934 /ORGANISM="Chaetoceros sp., Strain GSL56" /LENGTH=1008 /DNA_ID=CAMNT_0017901441 /DNA_START=84 /DNA_END=3110 /DNA_ORIENTATION=-
MSCWEVPPKNLLSDLTIDSRGWISCGRHSENETTTTTTTTGATTGTSESVVVAAAALVDEKIKQTKHKNDKLDNHIDNDYDEIPVFPACQKLLSLLQLKVISTSTSSTTTDDTNANTHGQPKNESHHHLMFTSLRSGKSYKILHHYNYAGMGNTPKSITTAFVTANDDDDDDDDNGDDHVDFETLKEWMEVPSNVMSDLISSTLANIMKMNCSSGRRSRKNDNDNGEPGGRRRNRNRNQNRNERNQNKSTLDDDINGDGGDCDGGNDNDKNQKTDQDSHDAPGNNDGNKKSHTYMSPSRRTMLTFNTISIFLPIVTFMIHDTQKDKSNDNSDDHHHVGNSDNGKKNKVGKRARKKKVYMCLKMARVFSVVTLGQFNMIKNDVERLETIIDSWILKMRHCHHHDWNHSLHQGDQNQDHNEEGETHNNLLQAPTTIPHLLVVGNSTQSLYPSCHGNIAQQTIFQFCNSTKELEYARKIDDAVIQPLIMDSHDDLHCRYRNSVQILCNRLSQILSRRFKNSHLSVYGSCLSGLSLGHSSDVDLSLYIPAVEKLVLQKERNDDAIDDATFQKQMKKFVYRVYDCIQDENYNHNRGRGHYHHENNKANTQRNLEFSDMQAVPFARVPVVKGRFQYAGNPFTKDGSIHFDICILNDIAVANSGLLREYSLLDTRVRMLMLSVKSWIKWKDIGNAAERTLSSYSWMLMVIFYLQCIGFVPNLQCRGFMEKHGIMCNYNENGRGNDLSMSRNQMHNINGLQTIYLHHDVLLAKGIWTQPKCFESTPVSALLLGFFIFYARYFSQETTAVSVRLGNMSMQKTVFSKSSMLWRILIEDPFEIYDSHIPHDLGTPMDEKGQENVTKALQEAANTMEQMFSSCDDVVDCIGSLNIVQHSATAMNEIADQKKQLVQQKINSRGGKSREKETNVRNLNVPKQGSKSYNYGHKDGGNDNKSNTAVNSGATRRNTNKKNGNITAKDFGRQRENKDAKYSNKDHSRSDTQQAFKKSTKYEESSKL